MSWIVLNPELRERCEVLARRAAEPARWYRPGPGVKVPGDDPLHVIQAGTYRIVFSWTVAPSGQVLRHVSITVRAQGRAPHPDVALTIAAWLGFAGAVEDERGLVSEPGPNWRFGVDENEGTMVLQQEVPAGELAEMGARA